MYREYARIHGSQSAAARALLPAPKNIGTTHITNGCYRLHPVEWNIEFAWPEGVHGN